MGILIARPIENAIESALRPIKANLSSIEANLSSIEADLSTIKGDLKTIMDTMVVPAGDALSQQIAVAIISETNVDGHGAIVYMKQDDMPGAESGFYLLSAAHVLITFLHWPEDRSICIRKGEHTFMFNHTGDLYIHSDYITHGSKDYGFLCLDLQSLDTLLAGAKVIETSWNEAVVGQSVVAHGQVYLRGTITKRLFGERGRFSVLAHSVPGQSGSLVFDNNRAVTGVVHGSSKHRGKHAAGADEDASVVYCDAVVFQGLICVNDKDLIELLYWAECIPEGVTASGVEVHAFLEKDDAYGLKNLLEYFKLTNQEGLKLPQVMEALLEKVPSQCVTFLDPKLVAWGFE